MWGDEPGKKPTGKQRTIQDEPLALASIATRWAERWLAKWAAEEEEQQRRDGWTLCSRIERHATVWQKHNKFCLLSPRAPIAWMPDEELSRGQPPAGSPRKSR